MSSIYKNLDHMIMIALHSAKEHDCNYNIILMNPTESGGFDDRLSTYEMVRDSYFEKDRPNVALLYRTDDLIRVENLTAGDHIAFGFNYNGGEPDEIVVAMITSKHPDEFIVHFNYGHHSLAESVKYQDVLAIGSPHGNMEIKGWSGRYIVVNHGSLLLEQHKK